MNIEIKIKFIDENDITELPEYTTDGSSGMDIRSSITKTLGPHEVFAIPTNISVEIPDGLELQIRPRSGLAIKNGITVLNTPGTIDSSYRGEIKVILYNVTDNHYNILKGDRIAQLVLSKVDKVKWNKVDSLSVTERGSGGFGHTGNQ